MLYITRPSVKVRKVDGAFIKFHSSYESPDCLKNPLLRNPSNKTVPMEFYRLPKNPKGYVASGGRSLLLNSGRRLFRVKACSFDDSGPLVHDNDEFLKIEGGQWRCSMEYEREYSSLYRDIVAREGLTTPMEVVGYFRYEAKARRTKMVSTVAEIQGDTRLDEFLAAIEALSVNIEDEKKLRTIGRFYYQIGQVVGSILRLMHDNGMTWSSDEHGSNSHIGNVVVYSDHEGKFSLGFVDFDSSSKKGDYSTSKHRKIKNGERFIITQDLDSAISFDSRKIFPPWASARNEKRQDWKERLENGIISGYNNTPVYSVDQDLFPDVFGILEKENDSDRGKIMIDTGQNILMEAGDETFDSGLTMSNLRRSMRRLGLDKEDPSEFFDKIF